MKNPTKGQSHCAPFLAVVDKWYQSGGNIVNIVGGMPVAKLDKMRNQDNAVSIDLSIQSNQWTVHHPSVYYCIFVICNLNFGFKFTIHCTNLSSFVVINYHPQSSLKMRVRILPL
jgi:hypothetical protein